jgi:hypothetical protein
MDTRRILESDEHDAAIDVAKSRIYGPDLWRLVVVSRKPKISSIWNLPWSHLRFDGTICGVAFQRHQIDNYLSMLKAARIALGLQEPDDLGKSFYDDCDARPLRLALGRW